MNQQIPLFLAEPASAPATTSLPLKGLGTTYSMAQAVRWLDERSFAIGRWDGTLTIFRRTHEQASAPVITAALVVPSVAGVEMIAQIKEMLFASSNDAKSIVVWCADTAIETGIRLKGTLTYDEAIGVANDGTTTEVDGVLYFVSGHANGYLLVWKVERGGEAFTLLHVFDLRSNNPVPSPYPLKNIRGVERWRPGYVVTGSEDGDICLVNVIAGTVVARMRYNDSARRGINDIDTCEDHLILANCSVGSDDRNIWLYGIHEGGFELLDSMNLKIDAALDQVFNFCVDQALIGEKKYFFAATLEGVVWVGLVENDRLEVLGKQDVSTHFGAALAYEPGSHLLAVAGDNIHLFEVQ
ncbi:MAG: WD40 repeat domain-containing protein [Acidobacteriota bacterium]